MVSVAGEIDNKQLTGAALSNNVRVLKRYGGFQCWDLNVECKAYVFRRRPAACIQPLENCHAMCDHDMFESEGWASPGERIPCVS